MVQLPIIFLTTATFPMFSSVFDGCGVHFDDLACRMPELDDP